MGNTCEKPPALTNFDASAYTGVWYEQQHVKGQWFQPDDSTCVQAIYTGVQSDGSFTVNNSMQDAGFNPRTGITGTGLCPDSTGRCYVNFFGPKAWNPNYIIVDTDYFSYSIIYSCGVFSDSLWLITRQPEISDDLYNNMISKTKKSLPNFKISDLAPRDYQGPKCTYVNSTSSKAGDL